MILSPRAARRLGLAAALALAASPALAQTAGGAGGNLGAFIRRRPRAQPQGNSFPSQLTLTPSSTGPRDRPIPPQAALGTTRRKFSE